MKKVKFIYNPFSGENTIISDIDKIIMVHQENGYVLEPYRISYDSPLESAFDNVDETFTYVLIAGGDGTVDNVVNAMKNRKIDLPIGILPTGTANDFAKYIGMSGDVEKDCRNILSSDIRLVDLGKINHKYFINVASFGLFTDVSQKTDINLKNTMGKLAYYIKGIEQIPNFKKLSIDVTSKDGEFQGDMYLMLIFNGQTAGNMKFAYKAEIEDGLLDVIIIKAGMIIDIINLLIEMIKGDHLDNSKGLIYFKTDKLEINSPECIVTDIDGERGPDFPLTITCEKKSLKILGING